MPVRDGGIRILKIEKRAVAARDTQRKHIIKSAHPFDMEPGVARMFRKAIELDIAQPFDFVRQTVVCASKFSSADDGHRESGGCALIALR